MATDTPATDIVLYDIAFRQPFSASSSAPNPWKARYALNFKGIPYRTEWVDMLEIPDVRRRLEVPAARKHRDGSDYYTLPVLVDNTTGTKVGDSFDIAVYLSETYPDTGEAGDLFPVQSLDFACSSELAIFAPPLSERAEGVDKGVIRDYAHFNRNVDAVFSAHSALMGSGMQFDPARAPLIRAEFERRAGMRWEDMMVHAGPREKILASLCEALAPLAELFQRDHSGPFLLGRRASHADFIVGGWLRMQSVTLPDEEWAQVKSWHGGVFAKLHDALQKLSEGVIRASSNR
ncbi:hypothetical protein ASPZODRAFT_170197 [Penicilliopsis zonata CBS 506.65]|uniref:GST N-terminal domain-containing protein n=1 Tax=Penicilliopsis zonata CBS 506.65 TaxID=1073090 RepID=A0A1L9S5H6_9EURO|nr:hypothetical protein ASPZODRAFT_170197 [Penicilliopsis zonata CBS 506.65]OJJ42408.1 hypothetical protein ASPZODRAFT_170197 [Penicilliopsis zonata CBS 506.65]